MNKKLQVFELETAEDLKKYNQYLVSINLNDPFSKIGLVFNSNSSEHKLNFFLFSINGIPKIIMIFIVRNVEIFSEKTIYKDVISPYGYSGPIISESTVDEEIIAFWEAVDLWYRKNNIISEFIRFSLNDNQRMYSGAITPTLHNVRGSIIDEDLQWQKFDKKVRNNYRKAVQNNLTFNIFYRNITPEIIEQFYHIYNSTMIRRSAESQFFYPFNYFEEYINENINNCATAMVYLDGKPISTEFLLLSNDTVYSYLGGTIADHFSARPNDYLKVKVLNWARTLGFSYYLLGGGRTNDDQLYAYKKSFFPKDDDVIFYTGRKIINETIYKELVSKYKRILESKPNNVNKHMGSYFPEYR